MLKACRSAPLRFVISEEELRRITGAIAKVLEAGIELADWTGPPKKKIQKSAPCATWVQCFWTSQRRSYYKNKVLKSNVQSACTFDEYYPIPIQYLFDCICMSYLAALFLPTLVWIVLRRVKNRSCFAAFFILIAKCFWILGVIAPL